MPPANPPASISWNPNYYPVCISQGTASVACLAAQLQATNAARAAEGVGPMVLPSNFSSLTAAEQLFVLADVERVDRGLPPLVGLVAGLSQAAQAGADTETAPALGLAVDSLGVVAYGSNWAADLNPLGANYNWMYNDGLGGTNPYCTPADTSSCWVHRDNILWNPDPAQLIGTTLVMGAAQDVIGNPGVSDAEVFALVIGTPAYVYTWADAQAAGAR